MTNETETNVDESDKDGAGQGMAPAERIRDLNDELRRTGIGGKTNLTRGMWALGSDFVAHAFAAVRAFDAFTKITTRGKSTTARRSTSTASASCSRSIITT